MKKGKLNDTMKREKQMFRVGGIENSMEPGSVKGGVLD